MKRMTPTFTLKKLVLALAIAGYTMSSAYAVLTNPTGSIEGKAPVLSAPSNSGTPHTVDFTTSAQGPTLATGDTITLTYNYNDADGDQDNSASTTHTQWYYVTPSGDVAIAASNIINTLATTASDGTGTSVLTIPAAAIGASAIKVVINEYSASGAPISGQEILVADTNIGGGGSTTPPGPIAPGSNVVPGIYLSTDATFANNLIGTDTKLDVGSAYVFKLWDDAAHTTDLTSSVTYNWRLVGTSATDGKAAPATGFVTSVTDANFTVPANSTADGTALTGSADGAQGFNLAVDYN
ncbi:SinI family autotransporter-associated protein [Yersinia enterocolitica]|uniref:SinI family autotransporter-associated protein n=1 Tax=Yersinia enterocolitica TaxID=630 RepID=UPI0030E26DC8